MRRDRAAPGAVSRSTARSEVIEPLPQGSFTGEYIDFGLDGAVRINHPTLSAEFVNTPLYRVADY
jgi:hypothetical protein